MLKDFLNFITFYTGPTEDIFFYVMFNFSYTMHTKGILRFINIFVQGTQKTALPSARIKQRTAVFGRQMVQVPGYSAPRKVHRKSTSERTVTVAVVDIALWAVTEAAAPDLN